MAYTKEQWDRAKAYYEGGLSLAKIKDKTGIARNTISQRAKREQWEHSKNTEYIEAKEVVAVEKGTILEQSGTVALEVADEIADDNIRRKGLVYGLQEKLVKKASVMADQIDTPNDLKTLVEATHKAGQTLGVVDQFAPKIDVTQLQQQGSTTTTVEIIEDKVE